MSDEESVAAFSLERFQRDYQRSVEVTEQGRLIIRGSRSVQVNIPLIIEPLWQIEVGRAFAKMKTHATYEVFEGSYGPYSNIIVKEATRYNTLAENELDVLPFLTGHPSFQQIRAAGTSGDKMYITVDMCNRSFQSIMNINYNVSSSKIPSVYRQLLEGVLFLPTIGFAHRDLTPENIFLSSDGHVKIGGLKYAMNLNGGTEIVHRRADILLSRLSYRYPEYGQGAYSWYTELFIAACLMNSLINGEDLTDDTEVVKPTAPSHSSEDYNIRHVLHLNKVLMFEDFADAVWFNGFAPVTSHHLFWGLNKSYLFIQTCYDFIDGYRVLSIRGEDKDKRANAAQVMKLKKSIEEDHEHLFKDTWPEKWLHRVTLSDVRDFLKENPTICFDTVFGLLATFRNRGAHHFEDRPVVRSFFGALPSKYTEKWLEMFPGFLSHMVRWAIKNKLHLTGDFHDYFIDPTNKYWGIVGAVKLNDYEAQKEW